MKSWAILVSALVLSATAVWAEDFLVKQTNDGYLNVRSGPGTSYDIMRRIYPGDEVTSLERKGRWFRVRLPTGGTGWVSSNFLEAVLLDTRDIRTVVQTSDGFLNLREGPGTQHTILRRLYPGDRLDVVQVRGNWVRVRTANGAEGWASRRFMR